MMRVVPPTFVSSRPVMSWRWLVNAFVVQGPFQFWPPSYEKKRPFFVPATTLLLLFGSTRTLPTASYCGNCPAGSPYHGPKTLAPSTVPCAPPSVDFRLPFLP